jgi:calcium binding protein 39
MSMIDEDLLYLLAVHLHKLPFESRKDTQVIFSYVFRFRPPNSQQKPEPIALAWVVERRPQVLIALCRGYDHKESATPAGTVLREVLKNAAAASIILYDDGDPDRPQSGRGVFWNFFDWIDKSSFEVSADAFTTFRVRLHAIPSLSDPVLFYGP